LSREEVDHFFSECITHREGGFGVAELVGPATGVRELLDGANEL